MVALVAVFCFSVAVASSAVATEKKGEVVNKNGGALTKNKFLGTSSTPGELETAAGSKLKCTGTTITGSISSKTSGEASAVFTGCTNASGNCSTSGAAVKEIKIPEVSLKGVPKEEKWYLLTTIVVGLSFHCGTALVDLFAGGSILWGISPESKLIKTTERAKLAAKGKAGKQEPEVATNHLLAKFGSGTYENASLTAEGLELAFEEEVEFI